MNVEVRNVEDITIVDCAGEVDLNSSPQLRDVLMSHVRSETPGVLLNMSDVTYMDSSGVATLVEGLQAARAARTRFALFGLRPTTRSVLEMARLDMIFVMFGDEHEALDRIWDVEPAAGP